MEGPKMDVYRVHGYILYALEVGGSEGGVIVRERLPHGNPLVPAYLAEMGQWEPRRRLHGHMPVAP
eukprot:3421034-Pyramimonas_sp.AAC.1